MIISSWFVPVAHAAASDLFQIPAPGGQKLAPNDVLPYVLNLVLSQLVSFAYPLGFICLLYCAYILITSAGKPEAYTKAKQNVTYLAIGIFLIVFAVVFLRFVTGLFLRA